jgi:hypothetical protein
LTSWGIYAKQIKSLVNRLGFSHEVKFLGYVVDLGSGRIFDEIRHGYVEKPETLRILLAHYSESKLTEKTGRLVRFADLPGGYAYEGAFVQRAVSPITDAFGNDSEMLVKAGEILNGIRLHYGDTSVEVPALPRIPLTYILWSGGDELRPSASVLFDASASNYLPTEDLAGLAELTTRRLEQVNEYMILKPKHE